MGAGADVDGATGDGVAGVIGFCVDTASGGGADFVGSWTFFGSSLSSSFGVACGVTAVCGGRTFGSVAAIDGVGGGETFETTGGWVTDCSPSSGMPRRLDW